MPRLCRWMLLVLLWGVMLPAPGLASDTLETSVAEIERLGRSAHWRESQAVMESLSARQSELSPLQRQRIEYVRLRNIALGGDQVGSLEGLSALLKQQMPANLRLRVYATAASIAANTEDWQRAFTWLGEGLAYLPEATDQSGALLGVASYLHALVGETERARDLAMRSLELVRPGDSAALCSALADVALAEDHRQQFAEAERWRRRQIEACSRASDLVFTANAKYGVGKMAAAQGRHDEAMHWARQALAEFEASGFEAGMWSARLVIAQSLIESSGDLDEASRLLDATAAYYRSQGSNLAVAETERQLARLHERRGDISASLMHLRQAMVTSEIAERDARERRLAYLQVEFDTRLKEHRIELLEKETELAALQATVIQRRQWLLAAGLGGFAIIALLLTVLLRRSFRERKRYRWLSERDGLTRLYNYQQIRKLGETAFAHSRRTGQPFTAIVADIDLFKEVNDLHGHAAGDEALRALGRWIHEELGAAGIAGRSGGDEFTILLDGDSASARGFLQRLRGRIGPIDVFGQTVHFSISCGICQANGHAATLEQLIHEADQALYRAKHGGRDRVESARGDGDGDGPEVQAGLVVVGSGIQFGRHASERCLSEIRSADSVLCLVDPFALGMIRSFRPDAINLGSHYADGKDRRQTYREIDAAIMAEVRAGKRVCAVFYGHPGVFADVPHGVVRKARAEGIGARMEPGISADACLYADLGIDPGRDGVQSLEATHFLVHDRVPDTAALVLLWQVALAGDMTCTRLHAEPEGLQRLADKLMRWYPPDHEVLLYEAARLPIDRHRAQPLPLQALASAQYQEFTTLVIPPLGSVPAWRASADGA